MLPLLAWNYDDQPDFNEEGIILYIALNNYIVLIYVLGFYLNYDHIMSAHPPLRDRMWYGLNRIAYFINSGVSTQDSYFIQCNNFEELLEKIYNGNVKLEIFCEKPIKFLFL